ncbi:hypothetical protein WJX77_012411 [Trebouxia sp. C0004]
MVKKKLGGSKNHKPVKPTADTTAAATDQDGDGPEPPSHVKKRLTKKLHFLEKVADSKLQALSATAGIRKKAHKSKHKQQKPLLDLNSLADLLAEVDQKQQALEAGQGDDGQPNKQKGRTEQINGSKARRAVTQESFGSHSSRTCTCEAPEQTQAAATPPKAEEAKIRGSDDAKLRCGVLSMRAKPFIFLAHR